jgi:CDP-diacylglycerol--serine O-phosphatidyltransferase
LGYSFGLDLFLDKIILCIFVCCGLARLARYNVTFAILQKNGSITQFQGFPIPSSLVIVALLWTCFEFGIELGSFQYLHFFSLLYLLWAFLMITSRITIPKI